MTELYDPDDRADEAWYRNPDALVESLQGDRCDPKTFGLSGYDDLVEVRRGAQGVVFSARQHTSGDRVAIKVLHEHVADRSRLRFLREIELVGQLRHPGIVSLLDRGETSGGRSYFVMPFVTGERLDEYVESHLSGAPMTDRLRLFVKICDAVGHAHQRGVIHRDLKPSNIRVDDDDEPRVLDFGLARNEWSTETESSELTMTTQFLGTVAYASPEQASGDVQSIDIRTDVYALGVVLYEMLDGGRPYDTSGSFSAALHAIQHASPRRIARNGMIDRSVEAIVMKALSKHPRDRYQSVDALATDVRRYLRGDPIDARPETTAAQLRKLITRHKVASALLAAILLLIASLAVVSTVAVSVINTKRGEAVAAQTDARDQYERAEAEASKVTQLAQFYESMFESVRPDQAGRDVLVLDVLDDAAARLDGEVDESAEVQAFLHRTLGQTYYLLGKYEQSIFHLERSVEIRAVIGATTNEWIATRADLGQMLGSAGRIDEGEAMMRTALEELQGLSEHDVELESQIVNALATIASTRSDYVAAEPLFTRALELEREHAPEDTMRLAAAINGLGMAKEMLGKYEESAELYREGLELMSGDEPSHVYARSFLIHNLANLEFKLGNHEESERLFRQSLAITKMLQGERHPAVGDTLETLGSLLTAMGRLDDAEACLEESLALRQEAFPEGHLKIAASMGTLAELRIAQGRASEAESLLRAARDVREVQLGDSHWMVGKTDARLSSALLSQERYEEAHELGVRGYDALAAHGGFAFAVRLGVVEHLCDLYETWPEPSPEAREAVMRIAAQGLDDPETAELAERLARSVE